MEESVYDEFCEKMVAAATSYKVGYWKEEGVNKGPIVSEKQMERIMGFIEHGRNSDADLLCGGNQIERDGFFIEPTLFGNVDPDSKIA